MGSFEQVQAVGAIATKEYSMLKTMEKMEAEWSGLEFKVMPYKDTGACVISFATHAVMPACRCHDCLAHILIFINISAGTFIIGGTDEVQTILDDQIVKIQAMNASPFVKPFKDRAENWEQTLQTLQVGVWNTIAVRISLA